jgi:hypothetical protein
LVIADESTTGMPTRQTAIVLGRATLLGAIELPS